MGLFGFLNRKGSSDLEQSWDENESMTCPRCGEAMTKQYSYSNWWCNNCHAELDNDDFDDEALSVYDAADIWLSYGKDEDYMFGYTEEELEDALR